jgi:hypothetical protein
VQALGCADRHELVVSRVKLDMIDAVPPRIEAFELGWMLVGEPPEFKRSGASYETAKRRQVFVSLRGAFSPHGLLERRVGGEQVHVDKGRALVEGLVV